MNRITKLGLAIMLFVILFASVAGNGMPYWDAVVYIIGLVGALLFIIPNDKKS